MYWHKTQPLENFNLNFPRFVLIILFFFFSTLRSFGGVFQPRTFSAQDLSISELLRTLWMCGCFWANILAVFEIPHPFPLNTHFGALAAGLGSFPFDCPTYLVQSDSRTAPAWHSEFDNLR